MLFPSFYFRSLDSDKYRNQLAEKQTKRCSLDSKKESGEQEGLPTLQEHGPIDPQKYPRFGAARTRLTPESKRYSQVRFDLDCNQSKEEQDRSEEADDKEAKSMEDLSGASSGPEGSTVEMQNNVVCVGTWMGFPGLGADPVFRFRSSLGFHGDYFDRLPR